MNLSNCPRELLFVHVIKWAFRNIKKDGQERDATSFDGHSKGGCRGWGSRIGCHKIIYIVHRTQNPRALGTFDPTMYLTQQVPRFP